MNPSTNRVKTDCRFDCPETVRKQNVSGVRPQDSQGVGLFCSNITLTSLVRLAINTKKGRVWWGEEAGIDWSLPYSILEEPIVAAAALRNGSL